MQNGTDRQGVYGVSQGQGGGRVYTVRNVDVDTQEWTGRVMLGNTLGRNRQDARVLHIPPTLRLLRKSRFHIASTLAVSSSRERSTFISRRLTKKEEGIFLVFSPLLACWSFTEATENWQELNYSFWAWLDKATITGHQIWMFIQVSSNQKSCKCVCVIAV